MKGAILLNTGKRLYAFMALCLTLVASSGCYMPGEAGADDTSAELAVSKPDLVTELDELEMPLAWFEPAEETKPAEYLSVESLYGSARGTPGCCEATAPTAPEPEPAPKAVTITISAAGDFTLGGDARGGGYRSFMHEFEQSGEDHSLFLRNVRHIFESDDLTLVNLECALTDATAHVDKTYAFRGPPHFARILSSSSVEAVTLANNHSGDYLERGYMDTIESLESEDVLYFGNDNNILVEVNGIKVGLFGYLAWNDGKSIRNKILESIEDLQDRGAELIIAYYHWGVERTDTPTSSQRSIGRFSIDSGVDLVLGSHPHVIQGIEVYEGKNIVYSLGNFCFGGNSSPPDQDTFIFQQTFTFEDGVLLDTNETNIIPARLSSDRRHNDFQPIVAQGADGERILQRIESYSDRLSA